MVDHFPYVGGTWFEWTSWYPRWPRAVLEFQDKSNFKVLRFSVKVVTTTSIHRIEWKRKAGKAREPGRRTGSDHKDDEERAGGGYAKARLMCLIFLQSVVWSIDTILRSLLCVRLQWAHQPQSLCILVNVARCQTFWNYFEHGQKGMVQKAP